MCKYLKRLMICCAIVLLICFIDFNSDKRNIREEMIRFRVIDNSDSPDNQAIKLKIRDAVLSSIQNDLDNISNISAAKDYLKENIPKIQNAVNKTLKESGYPECASVSLVKERFCSSDYYTITLPSGLYDTLRIKFDRGERQK